MPFSESSQNLELFYKVSGKSCAIPVVAIHGLYASFYNWQTVIKRLKSKYFFHALDLRNHGQSPHHLDMTYELMAQDVLHHLDRHQLKKVHLMGHSMGGKVAMALALFHPDRVQSLLIEDISPADAPASNHAIASQLANIPLDRIRSRREADTELSKHISDAALRMFLLSNLISNAGAKGSQNDTNAFFWRIHLRAILNNLDAIYGFSPASVEGMSYAGPVLFIKGENSNYLRPEHEPLIKKLFPKAEIQTIAGTNHWVHAQNPQEFSLLADAFWKTSLNTLSP